MCLNIIWTNEEKKEWLKNKPNEITAYKVAMNGLDGVSPLFQNTETFYCLTNKIEKGEKREFAHGWRSGKYRPYYHLCSTKTAAKNWQGRWSGGKIFKCKIPKKAITAIGIQRGYITIVTKEFTFVEKTELFKDGKQCA